MEQNIGAEEIQRPSQALGTHLRRPRGGKTQYLRQTALWAPRWPGGKTVEKGIYNKEPEVRRVKDWALGLGRGDSPEGLE